MALQIAEALFPMGYEVYIPMWNAAVRRVEILELTGAGRGVDEIARLIGCSNRTVRRFRKSLKKEGLP
ncbi:MAG: helix-turn-helix domain-containing protein [Methylocystis sp.]